MCCVWRVYAFSRDKDVHRMHLDGGIFFAFHIYVVCFSIYLCATERRRWYLCLRTLRSPG